MITPAIDCSTGVHSTPNPREGWSVGVPITRTVALGGGKTSREEGTCWARARAFTASVAACCAKVGEAHKPSITARAMASFMFPLHSGRPGAVLPPQHYLTASGTTRQRQKRCVFAQSWLWPSCASAMLGAVRLCGALRCLNQTRGCGSPTSSGSIGRRWILIRLSFSASCRVGVARIKLRRSRLRSSSLLRDRLPGHRTSGHIGRTSFGCWNGP
jgi:hypothetical protein